MRSKTIFLAHGQLRPIWRFFLSAMMIALAYGGAAIILGVVFGSFNAQPQIFVSLFWVNLLMLPALLGIFKIMTGVFEEKALGSVGLALRGRWKVELGIGLGVGAAMIFLVAVLQRLLGLVQFAWSSSPSDRILVAGCFSGALLGVAAINEEMVFRGYPFQRLVDSIGPVGAVLMSSSLFGVAHLRNPFHSWFSTLNTMLVGVPLAVAYLRTRALWMPIGIHFAWNFLQAFGFGLPVSGMVLPETLFKPHTAAATWLTGGSYGPEGGALALVSLVAATLYLSFSKSIYTSEEMKVLVFGAKPMPQDSFDRVGSPLTSTDPARVGRND